MPDGDSGLKFFWFVETSDAMMTSGWPVTPDDGDDPAAGTVPDPDEGAVEALPLVQADSVAISAVAALTAAIRRSRTFESVMSGSSLP